MSIKVKRISKSISSSIYPIVQIDMDTLSQSFTKFSKYLSLNLFYLIHSTVILITATQVKILDREAISNISYFGVFNRMFVYFNFYITHEAACDSLHGLNFCNHCFTTCCNVWPLYTTCTNFSGILKFFTALICILHVFSLFY